MSLELTIVTADKRFHFTRVSQVVVPTPLGQVGILPGHTPLVSLVTAGVLRITHADADPRSPLPSLFALDGGMARVSGDHIVLLLSEALPPGQIDRDKTLARSRELAAARNTHKLLNRAQQESLEEETAFNQAQLDVLHDAKGSTH